jgi:hypothetical protein
MNKVYRNIYFSTKLIKNGNGNLDVYYYGRMFANASVIKDFTKQYKPELDLLISCKDCASKKYRNFIKVSKTL